MMFSQVRSSDLYSFKSVVLFVPLCWSSLGRPFAWWVAAANRYLKFVKEGNAAGRDDDYGKIMCHVYRVL